MATLGQETGTGHNPRKEGKVADWLYFAIGVVVVVAFLSFLFVGKMNEGTTPNVGVPDQDRPADSTPSPEPPIKE